MANFWDEDETVSPAPAPAPPAPSAPVAATDPAPQAIPQAPAAQPANTAPAAAQDNWWDEDETVSPAPASSGSQQPVVKPPPTETPKPQRSMLGEVGHQVGLTARAAVNGIASLPAMAADALIVAPANAALSAYDKYRAPSESELVTGKQDGFRFKPQAQAMNSLMDTAGVSKPENATERVVQDATSAMAGTGWTMALGHALIKSGGPIAKATGTMLTQGPQMQVASAATSGAAAGGVREAGGGEGAQLAAGIAGAMVPGVASAPFGKTMDPSRTRLAASAQQANEAGYVIPAADLSDGPVAQLASAVSGKVKTAQEASYRNQSNSNRLAKEALGMQPEQALDMDSLAALRSDASKAYAPVANAGMVVPTKTYSDALDDAVSVFKSQARSFPNAPVPPVVKHIEALKSGQFDAGDGLNMIKVLRGNAEAAYRTGDKLAGASYKKAAGAIEGALEDHLVGLGAPAADVLKQYRDARQLIAKSYDVQGALNPTTGNVNAIQLAAKLRKGRPLTDELRTIAEVSQAFPKATETLKQAPGQNSVLDVASSLVGLTATGSPLSLLTLGGRPAVRNSILSEIAQKRLVKGAGLKSQPIPDGKMAIGLGEALRANQRQEEPPPYVELRGMADKPMNRIQAGNRAYKNGGIVEKVEGGYVVRPKPMNRIQAGMQAFKNGGVVEAVPGGYVVRQAPAAQPDPAHDAATSPHNDHPEPTDAQKQAGNYRVGRIKVNGMDISVENPEGSTRRGTDADGTPWETQMQGAHYGYLRGTRANDGDKLDVFVKTGTAADYTGPVFVIDQVDPKTGKLDEHKCVIGVADAKQAEAIYRSNYAPDWQGLGAITKLPMIVFKAWARSGKLNKPLGDLKEAKT